MNTYVLVIIASCSWELNGYDIKHILLSKNLHKVELEQYEF